MKSSCCWRINYFTTFFYPHVNHWQVTGKLNHWTEVAKRWEMVSDIRWNKRKNIFEILYLYENIYIKYFSLLFIILYFRYFVGTRYASIFLPIFSNILSGKIFSSNISLFHFINFSLKELFRMHLQWIIIRNKTYMFRVKITWKEERIEIYESSAPFEICAKALKLLLLTKLGLLVNFYAFLNKICG